MSDSIQEMIEQCRVYANDDRMCGVDIGRSGPCTADWYWDEVADKLESLFTEITAYQVAAQKVIDEFLVEDQDHSAACMNWAALEHSQHQCGICDLREILSGREGS